MKITPLDISQRSFARSLRGFERQEVEAFLALVASEFEGALKELQNLKDELRRKDEQLAELRGRERALQETMITAQKACEEIREAARKEAEITLAEAELQAEKIVQSAHQRYLRVVDDMSEMKRQRAQFASSLRAVVEGHLKLLEAFGEGSSEGSLEFLPLKKKTAEEK